VSGAKLTSVLVAVVMGSDSDIPVMQEAADILQYFSIKYEVRILSAHRTADKMIKYASCARKRGILAIIAGAGGAAHLPGMIAAITSLPVIGVPIKTSSLNGARNAGLLASQIVGTKYKEIGDRVKEYKIKIYREVNLKDIKLQNLGIKKYIS
jgi:5-(carboxyamino)imidazole ribonucleotide mutase